MEKEKYKLVEAANYLGTSVTWVMRRISKGILTSEEVKPVIGKPFKVVPFKELKQLKEKMNKD